MSEHTPGPWHYELPGDTEMWIMGPDNHGFPHAKVYEDGSQGGDMEANARLIVAAPLMLSILEYLTTYPIAEGSYPEGPSIQFDDMVDIKAAIAKATGKEQAR
jgi:hypothetical protein